MTYATNPLSDNAAMTYVCLCQIGGEVGRDELHAGFPPASNEVLDELGFADLVSFGYNIDPVTAEPGDVLMATTVQDRCVEEYAEAAYDHGHDLLETAGLGASIQMLWQLVETRKLETRARLARFCSADD